MAQLKWIEFYTENCETFKIDGKYVGDLLCGDLKTNIRRVASNSIEKFVTAEEFSVELFAGGNQKTSYDPAFVQTAYERLHYYNDITEVILYFDDEVYGFCPVWEDATANGEENMCQVSYISSSGNLYITISLKPFHQYFDKEEIDDQEYMKIKAEFYGVESEAEDD